MFSGDAAEMVEVTGSALHESGEAFRFNLLDVLPIIGGIRMKQREKLCGSCSRRWTARSTG